MAEKIFIGVAWPYANGPLHLGHIAGAYLPADIFARFHRTRGDSVLMVSGSDQHGTPITVQAEAEGIAPEDVVKKYHTSFVESWRKLGIGFDLYTTTGTENHRKVVHDLFRRLYEKGYIYRDSMPLPFCPSCRRFLPDRYVEGTCPYCHTPGARGDQCERCGKPINPLELLELRCRICGSTPHIRESEHLFLKLSAFEEGLRTWVSKQAHWRPNVYNFTLGFLNDGLKDRAITRDLEWGVPVPGEVAGFEHKRIYVWFEAVIGYLSASKQWAQEHGKPELWQEFWQDPRARSWYFIGKDNIPFHTIIWPAMLMAYGGLNLPFDVPANEFLGIEGKKLSTSRNWAVWVPDYLQRFEADPLRYYLSVVMPESGDADFSWKEFLRRNNDELVATYGNLAHRVLTFTYRNFQGKVPDPGPLDGASQGMLKKSEETLADVGEALSRCHFQDGLRKAMALAQGANRYLDEKAPWRNVKQDRQGTATTLWTAIAVLSCLRTCLYPFLPFSSEKLHEMLGCSGTVEAAGWKLSPPPAGQPLASPSPLFVKLEESYIEGEVAKFSHAQ